MLRAKVLLLRRAPRGTVRMPHERVPREYGAQVRVTYRSAFLLPAGSLARSRRWARSMVCGGVIPAKRARQRRSSDGVQPLRQAQRAEQGELRPRLRPAGPEGVLPNTGRHRLPGARARKPRILRAAADGAGGAW